MFNTSFDKLADCQRWPLLPLPWTTCTKGTLPDWQSRLSQGRTVTGDWPGTSCVLCRLPLGAILLSPHYSQVRTQITSRYFLPAGGHTSLPEGLLLVPSTAGGLVGLCAPGIHLYITWCHQTLTCPGNRGCC